LNLPTYILVYRKERERKKERKKEKGKKERKGKKRKKKERKKRKKNTCAHGSTKIFNFLKYGLKLAVLVIIVISLIALFFFVI